RVRDDLREGIEVQNQHVDRGYAVAGDGVHVVLPVAASKQRAVDGRVQRLDAPLEDLRETGQVADLDDLQPGVAQRPGCAAGGYQFQPGRGEPAPGLLNTRLVRDADQCPRHRRLPSPFTPDD